MTEWIDLVLDFIKQNRFWAGPVIFALGFAESMAFLSLLVPFTGMIFGIGALVWAGTLDPWTVIPWGIAGASFGDAVSYWIGRLFDKRIAGIWPFRQNPDMLDRGHRFFERWGTLSVFIGRFFGPLRAVVPIVAGIMDMPQWKFQLANIVSAVVWLPLLLAFGAGVGKLLADWFGLSENYVALVVIGFFIAASIVAAFAVWLRQRGKGA